MPSSSGAPAAAPSAAYAAACAAIFGPHLAHRPALDAGGDWRTRRPDLALALAAARCWLPDRACVMKVVGSKGKGGVARRIAAGLTMAGEGPVGLFVSPEEIAHRDRIRIDGAPLSETAFAALWATIADDVAIAARRRDPPVFPPFGALYVLALAAFAQVHARWIVLEAGRGGRWDDVGATAAAFGVATRLLPEHRDRLGPDLARIADQKLGGLADVDHLIAHPSFAPYLRRAARVVDAPPWRADRPFWLGESDALADAALAAAGAAPPPPSAETASFFARRIGSVELIADGAIHPDCVDRRFYAGFEDAVAIVAAPADKARAGLVAAVGSERPCATLDLLGPRGAGAGPRVAGAETLAAIGQTDAGALGDRVAAFACRHRARRVLLFGDQTALRLARRLPVNKA